MDQERDYSKEQTYHIEMVYRTILVTGANGQLGNELRQISSNYPAFHFLFTDVEELDITNLEAIRDLCQSQAVGYILNCAAYTAVDRAEEVEATAHLINATAVEHLAHVAAERNIPLIHISTDYVFDGQGSAPLTEEHPTAPQSAYGRTKLAGEEAILKLCPSKGVVIRTAWLYSAYGNNFVKTMLRLGRERNTLNVVADQIGTPTYAADLALAMMRVVEYAAAGVNKPGVYHYSNDGACSWYDFTCEIHRQAGITTCAVTPIPTTDYPTPAARPAYSVLSKAKIIREFDLSVPSWQSSLARCLATLLKELPNSAAHS